jgi:hypothetical protein
MSENIIKHGNTGLSKIANEYKAIKVRNEDDVFNSKNKSLILMTPEIGEMGVKALLSYAISDLVDFFNLGKTMTVEQIAQTVELIIEEFGILKIDDFKLCFSRAKKGYYGQVYDRLDGQIILLWLNTYAENRFNIAEEKSYRNHLETKQSFLNTSERLKEEVHQKELKLFKLKNNVK